MKILVFQHVPVEHPGILRDFWREAGHDWSAVELDAGEPIPALGPFDLLVAMGGPMDVWEEEQHPWLKDEKAAIRHWVTELKRPFLGICLGHQLLADALGGMVALMDQPEVGVGLVDLTEDGRADPVTQSLGGQFSALHWHGAAVSRMPQGAVCLAQTSSCRIQAMRWGRHAYGVQCHIEITATTVEEWRGIPEYGASLERTLGTDGAERLSKDVIDKIDTLNAAARQFNAALLSQVVGAS